MTRQIKFRVWDNQLDKYLDNAAGTHCISRLMLDLEGRLYEDIVVLSDSGNEPHYLDRLSDSFYFKDDKLFLENYVKGPRYRIERFTGKTDKTGAEIFEGDLVKFTHPAVEKPYSCEGVVEWDNDLGYFRVVYKDDTTIAILNIYQCECELICNQQTAATIKTAIKNLEAGQRSKPSDLENYKNYE